MIRPMRAEDVAGVVSVHLASFPGFFLTSLGPRFLCHFYAGVLCSREGIALVEVDAGEKPVGFVVGSSNPRGFYSRLLKSRWHYFACAALLPVLRNPKVALRIARGLLHPGKNPPGAEVAGLFSLGVLPETQGRGTGRSLVHLFLQEAKERGCRRVFLTTDGDGNDSVNTFYKKLGFSVERDYLTPEGRRMNEYWINL